MVTDLLPLALAVAISPLPIAATIVLLLSVRADSVGWGFSAGIVGGITVAATAAALLSLTLDPAVRGAGAGSVWLRIAVGILLLALGVHRLVRHSKTGPAATAPRWLTTLDRLTFGRAIALGLLLSVGNPKNLPIALTAGVTIADAGRSPGASAVALGLFVLVATSTVLAPVLAHRLAPARVARPFRWLRRGLVRHGWGAATAVLLVVGALVLLQGLGRL